MPEDNSSTLEELQAVGETLTMAGTYNLEAEVVLFALKHAQAHPTATIQDCMDAGYAEWVK
jgi:hypothetical protein